MAAPDLSRARAKMAELMVDTCRVVRDVWAQEDDRFDPETLTWARPSDDMPAVYEGRVLLRGKPRVGSFAVEVAGEQDQVVSNWTAAFPFDADIRPGDLLTVTGVADGGDQHMVGMTLIVREVVSGTFAAARRATLEQRTPVPRGRPDYP